jgi:hypothetical protein
MRLTNLYLSFWRSKVSLCDVTKRHLSLITWVASRLEVFFSHIAKFSQNLFFVGCENAATRCSFPTGSSTNCEAKHMIRNPYLAVSSEREAILRHFDKKFHIHYSIFTTIPTHMLRAPSVRGARNNSKNKGTTGVLWPRYPLPLGWHPIEYPVGGASDSIILCYA